MDRWINTEELVYENEEGLERKQETNTSVTVMRKRKSDKNVGLVANSKCSAATGEDEDQEASIWCAWKQMLVSEHPVCTVHSRIWAMSPLVSRSLLGGSGSFRLLDLQAATALNLKLNERCFVPRGLGPRIPT
jgi:hypothetical protein